VIVGLPAALWTLALGTEAAWATGCVPAIGSVSTVTSAYDGSGRIDINGSCFGTAAAFVGADRAYLRLSDLSPGAQLPNSNWNACWTEDPGTDQITCDVSEWSDTHIVFAGFAGAYQQGAYQFHAGDRLAVQVWNAQTLAGPAVKVLGVAPAAPLPTGRPAQPAAVLQHSSRVSSIAGSLATPRTAFGSLRSDVINASIAVAAALFITFPANLFNQTLEENYADISAWWRRRLRWVPRRQRTAAGMSETGPAVHWPSFAAVIVGGSLLGGLLDPHFGVNVRSMVNVLALATAICIGIFVPFGATKLFHQARHDSTRVHLRAIPAGLLIAAACVLLSRLSGFQPGYLYGIVAGLAFGRALAKREQAHLIILSTLAVIAVSLAAWFGWLGVHRSAANAGASPALVWLDDALAATFVAGLVGSVISMLPLRFLPGRVVKSWSRTAWAGMFCVALFGLVQVMLRPHATAAGPSHSPLVTTVVLFVLFAAATFAFRWHFVRKRMREAGLVEVAWQHSLRRLLGEDAPAAAQLAATTDGVAIIDLTDAALATQVAAVPAPRTPAAARPAPRTPAPSARAPRTPAASARASRTPAASARASRAGALRTPAASARATRASAAHAPAPAAAQAPVPSTTKAPEISATDASAALAPRPRKPTTAKARPKANGS
jgi:hypothetical protein